MMTLFLTSVFGLSHLPAPLQVASANVSQPPLTAPLLPPPPATKLGPKIVIGLGAALVITGIVGMSFSGGCQTHSADGRCLDPRGTHPAFPSMTVLGVGAMVTGGYWYRQTHVD
ncbi:MAG: hypothetical protein VX589_20925 [Myxococcota bacterium]|nr:hypothetical protein [Myxococcota bacterium]